MQEGIYLKDYIGRDREILRMIAEDRSTEEIDMNHPVMQTSIYCPEGASRVKATVDGKEVEYRLYRTMIEEPPKWYKLKLVSSYKKEQKKAAHQSGRP